MTTSLKRKQNKPQTVEVNYMYNRVSIKNIFPDFVFEFRELIILRIVKDNAKFMHLDIDSKQNFFLLFAVHSKFNRLNPFSKTWSLTIPEAVAIYKEFSKEAYIGTYINYTASLIHQKLS